MGLACSSGEQGEMNTMTIYDAVKISTQFKSQFRRGKMENFVHYPAYWHYATSRKVAGSSPDEVNSSGNMALGSTQPLTQMSTRKLPGG
jgi:hypothetical protein